MSAPEEGTVVPDEVEDSVVEGPIGREEFNALATRLEEIALMIQGLAGVGSAGQIARGAAGLRPQGGRRSEEDQAAFEERQAAQRLVRKKTLAQRP